METGLRETYTDSGKHLNSLNPYLPSYLPSPLVRSRMAWDIASRSSNQPANTPRLVSGTLTSCTSPGSQMRCNASLMESKSGSIIEDWSIMFW